jgi:hypothetical protein
MLSRACLISLCLAIVVQPLRATSIVVWITNDRVLFAADSRTGINGKTGEQIDDRSCKIRVMNDGAYALNGLPDLHHLDDDSVAWDGSALGKEMYLKHKGNLFDAANDWANQSVEYWTPFFSHQIADGEEILRKYGTDVVDFDVAGFLRNPDHPVVVIGSVTIDRSVGPPRIPKALVDILGPRAEPYSSNPVTEEFIEAKTKRAKDALNIWLPKLKSIKESERNMRTLEYLIQQTAKHDPNVNGIVNVLEITANKRPRWLQNRTCK